MKNVSTKIANKVNALGFSKNGKPMQVDQANEVLAAIAGLRNFNVLLNMRKKDEGARAVPLALIPDHPEKCDGTDFVMADDADGIWIKMGKAHLHICRGSAPRSGDDGLRIMVYGYDSLGVEPVAELQVAPEALVEDKESVEPMFTNHYLCVCGHEWTDEWSCACDDDCPVCATTMEPYASNDGSLSDADIDSKQTETCALREYVVSDSWGHIFFGQSETIVRFVFSRKTQSIIAMEVSCNGGSKWVATNAGEKADVNDSLINANEDFLVNPYLFGGGYTSDKLPSWAEKKQ